MDQSEQSIETIGHSRFCTVFIGFPSTNTTIILLGNTGRALLNAITDNTIGILYDVAIDLPQKSAAVLELAMEQFPEAFNLYASFGEVLLKWGEREKS